MDVNGMTAAELANMSMEQFNRLSMREAEQALTILNRAVNKSLRRAEAAGTTNAPAVRQLMESGGKIKTRGHANINEAKSELARARSFMTSKTRTVTGAKAHQRQAAEYLGMDKNASAGEISNAAAQLDRVLEQFPMDIFKVIGYKKATPTDLSERIQRDGEESAVNWLRSMYEQAIGSEAAETARYEQDFSNQNTIE